jgi:hypothetical protein
MGYWNQGADGHSFALDSELVWGDAPADIMGAALEEIIKAFQRDRDRLPTQAELNAGLLFSSRPALERAAKEPVRGQGKEQGMTRDPMSETITKNIGRPYPRVFRGLKVTTVVRKSAGDVVKRGKQERSITK